MDADKSSAARKLPQTAANYFVGTNSRVPRMTLAQSSVTIPIPAPKSPGTGASPGVAPGSKVTFAEAPDKEFIVQDVCSVVPPASCVYAGLLMLVKETASFLQTQRL